MDNDNTNSRDEHPSSYSREVNNEQTEVTSSDVVRRVKQQGSEPTYSLALTARQLQVLDTLLAGQITVVRRRISQGRQQKKDKTFRTTEQLHRKVREVHIDAQIGEALSGEVMSDERVSEILSQWTDELS